MIPGYRSSQAYLGFPHISLAPTSHWIPQETAGMYLGKKAGALSFSFSNIVLHCMCMWW